jgi:adenine-specific DNA methylase
MKYMGSKRWMLDNGLGHVLIDRARQHERFVDLFSGTAAVSWHVAVNVDVPVLAVDLQVYSEVLAKSVIGRTRSYDSARLRTEWLSVACSQLLELSPSAVWARDDDAPIGPGDVMDARELCAKSHRLISRSYGGYYFSPFQALAIDLLLDNLPAREPERSICLAALISAAARCAASPGHTAQPFQPSAGALPYLREAWAKDIFKACAELLGLIAGQAALQRGHAMVGDALTVAVDAISKTDLVFLDPPYSAAQYSRFYHVLETIARGSCGPVSGVGRYPPFAERPRSLFSLAGEASSAMTHLLETLGKRGCGVVMTFPQHGCSNGVVGESLIGAAREWFEVDVTAVRTRHSTLGGNNSGRSARRSSVELILSMQPRRRKALG